MSEQLFKSKVREKLVDAFISSLNEEKIPWHKTWNVHPPENASTHARYRGINYLMLTFFGAEMGFKDHRWSTFNQAQSQGWRLQKGAKGVPIEFWSCYDKKQKKNISIQEANLILREHPERQEDIRFVAKTYTVFNAEQIEGIPALEKKDLVTSQSDKDIEYTIDTLIKTLGVTYHEQGSQAYYQPVTDSIVLPNRNDFQSMTEFAATALHEMAHSTGHLTRLNRDLSGRFGSEQYAKEELRAEIASAFVSNTIHTTLSEDHIKNHKAYIQHWIQVLKDEPNELFKAIKDAEAISDYLIDRSPSLEKEVQSPEKAPQTPEIKTTEPVEDKNPTPKESRSETLKNASKQPSQLAAMKAKEPTSKKTVGDKPLDQER